MPEAEVPELIEKVHNMIEVNISSIYTVLIIITLINLEP